MNVIQRIRHSLSARLMLLFLGTGLLIIVLINLMFGMALRHQFQTNIRPHIRQYIQYAVADIGNPPSIEQAQALAGRVPVKIHILGPEVNWSSTGQEPDYSRFQFEKDRSKGRLHRGEFHDRIVFRGRSGDHTLFFEIDRRARHGHGKFIGLIFLATIIGILILCYSIIRWLFRPIETIERGVKRIGGGELNHRIDIKRKDQLGDLGRSVNAMADDIEQMLEAKRQLLLGISHELRSPITRAKVSVELLDDSEGKQNINDDLKEMETLITEILETERLNTHHQALNKEDVSINTLINDVMQNHFSGRDLDLQLLQPDQKFSLDPSRIRLLLMNLISNALRHTESTDKTPEVSAELKDNTLVLTVRDHGVGIAAEHITRLTEPFYRADPSRQRKTGGYGLGLYLCRVIAEAHGGSLNIESKPGNGTTVQVRIPG